MKPLLLLLSLLLVATSTNARRRIATNNPITVNRGRSVFLSPADLEIEFEVGDRCEVRILRNNPLEQTIGFLTPDRFPCDFAPNTVQYIHLGSLDVDSDRVSAQAVINSATETIVIPFVLIVDVAFVQLEIVTNIRPLDVPQPGGTSDPIDGAKLTFTYDDTIQTCHVTLLSSADGLPRYGELTNADGHVAQQDCADFLALGIRYVHTKPPSPNRDHIPMVVELRDIATGEITKKEFFQMLVRIRNGIENTAPVRSFDAVFLLEVHQYIATAITRSVIGAEDSETPAGQLIFNITSGFGEGEGYLFSTDDRNQALTSFRQQDVFDLKIGYSPPKEDSDQRRLIEIKLQIVDSEGAKSSEISFLIIVNPKNTLAPIPTRNRGLMLYEGQRRAITRKYLVISDEDNVEDVTLTFLFGPHHGSVYRLVGGVKVAVKTFTMNDLKNGVIWYEHDGTDTNFDNVVLRASDGTHDVDFLFPIVVVSVDDESPVLLTNTGIVMNEGELVPITEFVLSASDVDSDDSTIHFIVTTSPRHGRLIIQQINRPDNVTGYTFTNGIYSKVVTTSFTWQDVVDGKLFYFHDGSETNGDSFSFTLVDGEGNRSPIQTFRITINGVDDAAPAPVVGKPFTITVHEKVRTPITGDVVLFTDVDSDDDRLTYVIIGGGPQWVSAGDSGDPGRLVACDNPSQTLTSFTQRMLRYAKVCYEPPREVGTEIAYVRFFFTVVDPLGHNVTTRNITISVMPVDDEKSAVVVPTSIPLKEGTSVVIDRTFVHVTDGDSRRDQIFFTIISIPENGFVSRRGVPLKVGDNFTMADIDGGFIIYRHSGSETSDDIFRVVQTDGTNTNEVPVRITVVAVDDTAPRLLYANPITVEENGISVITAEIIKATDVDSDDLTLRFVVVRPPTKGEIRVGGVAAMSFLQEDVANGRVTYVHTDGEIGLLVDTDIFVLDIADQMANVTGRNITGGNVLRNVVMFVSILPVDDQAPIPSYTPGFVVVENGRSQITFLNFSISDVDSEVGAIICRITVTPEEGFVENIAPKPGGEKSQANKPISVFTYQDILDGNIFYVQNQKVGESVEATSDRFALTCGDEEGNEAPQIDVDVDVQPKSDEKPELFIREFVVDEGGDLVIDRTILNAQDADVPSQTLTFVITKEPQHGEIVEQLLGGSVKVTRFTLDQIDGVSTIIYTHDGSETTEDSFSITLTDGENEVIGVVTVTVNPVDDESPRLKTNRGVRVDVLGGTTIVDKRILSATDLDTDDTTILYILRQVPRIGYLQIFVNGAWRNTTLAQNFTQQQINDNHVRFVSNGKEGGLDRFRFDLSDGRNVHFDREVVINVRPVDNTPPKVTTRMLIVNENGFTVITTSHLSATDDNSNDKDLTFTLLTPPEYGHLENTDSPGVPISFFTQLQLAGNKIRYVHTDSGENSVDRFEVRVSDGTNDVIRSLMVRIAPGDDELPVLENRGLRLDEGATKVVTPYELNVEDSDAGTDDKKLVYVVKRRPMHGRLLRKGHVVLRFNQHDIDNGYISYEHDGTDTTSDDFLFTVSDSVHDQFIALPDQRPTRTAQTFKITVNPIEDARPELQVVNPIRQLHTGGSSMNNLFPVDMIGSCLSSGNLRATDQDSDDGALEYWFEEAPQHGYFADLDNASRPLLHFTQQQVNEGRVCYILKDVDAVATGGDSFIFKIMDGGRNALINQRFTLTWAILSMEKSQYTVNENAKHLTVTVIRQGDLNQPAFVKIAVASGTATKGVDFKGHMSSQLYFAVGARKATYNIRILNDKEYEKSEDFTVTLSDPVKAILRNPSSAVITIVDPEDEPSFTFGEATYRVEEDVGVLRIPITRTGDTSKESMVTCTTTPGTATGTVPSTVLSFSDYITRPASQGSSVMFEYGDVTKYCEITIVEDTQNEDDEDFTVSLVNPMGGKMGAVSETKVTIVKDESDVPVFHFEFEEYRVNESDGHVSVKIIREGIDLSQMAAVQFVTAVSKPKSAQSGLDYIPKSEMVQFAPGVQSKTIRVTILDDTGNPVLEGSETFEVLLRMPMHAVLGSVSRATITIDDSTLDIPTMHFKQRTITVNEEDRTINVVIVRTGDLSNTATVRCVTRQSSAQVMMDYAERPNTDASIVTFAPGEREKMCTVQLMDDSVEEKEEMFELVLLQPQSPDAGGAKVDRPTFIRIVVKDQDKSSVGFENTRYRVREPAQNNMSYIIVPVVRTGDTTKTSIFDVYTQDVSAIANIDYEPFSRVVEFGYNVSRVSLRIGILGDGVREAGKTFKIIIEPDQNRLADLINSRATIFIDDYGSGPRKPNGDGTQAVPDAVPVFPAAPEVVSLQDYDSTETASDEPSAGYPLVCVTSCNPKYSDYATTRVHCTGVNDSMTYYYWEVANVNGDLERITLATFMTSVNSITLDSIYFQSGSRVRCTSVPRTGVSEGPSQTSDVVTIGPGDEFCPRFNDAEVGIEPHSTRFEYLGPDDVDHPNMVKVTVRIQHVNGLIPVISTRSLESSSQLIGQTALRSTLHSCSNLLQPQELVTRSGFSSTATGNEMALGNVAPYQYSATLRSEPTLRFYRNLDLDKCMWTFVGYYTMDELVTTCGGEVDREPTVRDNSKSHLTVRVPLHVGFYYVSRGQANQVTQAISPETKLRMSFVYDTQVLWENGLSSSTQQLETPGTMYPKRIYISETGQLVVEFSTIADFRGQFVADGSVVVSTRYPSRQFDLTLVSSDSTVENAEQTWRFTSTLSHSDYSDTYEVHLVPCIVAPGIGYTNPLQCQPADQITLDMPLRFQQTTAPVKAEYTLGTQFFVLNKRAAWLMEASADFGAEMDQTFSEDSIVYGRVQVDPAQRIGDSYNLKVEQVYVCSGKNGYSASFDPASSNFGCLSNPSNLLFSYKILDRRDPGSVVQGMSSVPFNAQFATETVITSDSNVDGFSFSAAPLYTTGANSNVYVHALYSIGRGDRRRRAIFHAVSKRADEVFQLKDDEGTGMQILRLEAKNTYERVDANTPEGPNNAVVPIEPSNKSSSSLIPIIAGVVGGIVVVAIIAIAVVFSRRRRNSFDVTSKGGAPPPPAQKAECDDNDNTEV